MSFCGVSRNNQLTARPDMKRAGWSRAFENGEFLRSSVCWSMLPAGKKMKSSIFGSYSDPSSAEYTGTASSFVISHQIVHFYAAKPFLPAFLGLCPGRENVALSFSFVSQLLHFFSGKWPFNLFFFWISLRQKGSWWTFCSVGATADRNF